MSTRSRRWNSEKGTGQPAAPLTGLSVGAALALLGLYLAWLLVSAGRRSCEFTLMHFLFDYRYGVTRRALEGELARHFFPPPYGGEFFLHLTFFQMALALALFLAVAALALCQRRSRSLLLLIFAAATSSLVFKNYLFDQGRQDVFGLLLAEVLLIFRLIGWDRAAQIVLGIAIIPLCLVADNQIFLFVPTCLALVTLQWDEERIIFQKYSWVLLLVGVAGLSLSFVLPPPRLPAGEYRQYLQTKTTYALTDDSRPELGLYSTVRDNVKFTFAEFHRFESTYKKRLADFIFALGVNLLVIVFAASTLRGRRALLPRYLGVTGAIAVCYLPLFFLGEDYSRWTANLTTCVYLVGIYAVAQFGSGASAGGILLVAVVAFQAWVQHGFGVITPIFGEPQRLVSPRLDLAEAHFSKAVDLARMPGQRPEALAQYEEALRLSPRLVDAHISLGAELTKIPGRMSEAIAHYETALRIDPENAEAHNDLAVVLATIAGRKSEALAHYETAIRIRPDFPEAHNNFGYALENEGRMQEAASQFEQALRLRPDYAQAHCNLANVLRTLGRREEAISHYRGALSAKPDYGDAHNNLGVTLIEAGRAAEAIDQFAQALRLQPNQADVHRNLGAALRAVGRNDEADAEFKKATELQGSAGGSGSP